LLQFTFGYVGCTFTLHVGYVATFTTHTHTHAAHHCVYTHAHAHTTHAHWFWVGDGFFVPFHHTHWRHTHTPTGSLYRFTFTTTFWFTHAHIAGQTLHVHIGSLHTTHRAPSLPGSPPAVPPPPPRRCLQNTVHTLHHTHFTHVAYTHTFTRLHTHTHTHTHTFTHILHLGPHWLPITATRLVGLDMGLSCVMTLLGGQVPPSLLVPLHGLQLHILDQLHTHATYLHTDVAPRIYVPTLVGSCYILFICCHTTGSWVPGLVYVPVYLVTTHPHRLPHPTHPHGAAPHAPTHPHLTGLGPLLTTTYLPVPFYPVTHYCAHLPRKASRASGISHDC